MRTRKCTMRGGLGRSRVLGSVGLGAGLFEPHFGILINSLIVSHQLAAWGSNSLTIIIT